MGNEKLDDLEPQGDVKGGVRVRSAQQAVSQASDFAADHNVKADQLDEASSHAFDESYQERNEA